MLLYILFFVIYRSVIYVLLKREYGDRFVFFLNGVDNIWYVEKATGRAIVNVLFHLKRKPESDESEILNNIIRRFATVRFSEPGLQKMFYKRKMKYGYHFWERHDQTDMKTYVNKPIEADLHSDCIEDCKLMGNEELNSYLSRVSNMMLPLDNTATWEIFVGKPCPKANEKGERLFPLLYRFHHSLTDGLGIFALLHGPTYINPEIADKVYIKDYFL